MLPLLPLLPYGPYSKGSKYFKRFFNVEANYPRLERVKLEGEGSPTLPRGS